MEKRCLQATSRSVLMSLLLVVALIISMVGGGSLPAQAASVDSTNLWNQVKADYAAVTYTDLVKHTNPRVRFIDRHNAQTQLRRELGREPTPEEVDARVYEQYEARMNLGNTLSETKTRLDQLMPELLDAARGQGIDAEYLRTNKNPILLGLTYLQHYYTFDLAGKTPYDRMATGPNASAMITLLKNLGNSGYDRMVAQFSADTFRGFLARMTGQPSLTDYITNVLAAEAPGTTPDSWLAQTSKAIIIDRGTKTLFHKYATDPNVDDHLLPLLALSSASVYVGNIDQSISYGQTSTYGGDSETFRNALNRTLDEQIAFWAFWGRMSTTMNNINQTAHVVSYDNHKRGSETGTTARERWSPKYGQGVDPAVADFFYPLNKYSDFTFASGVAQGTDIRYWLSDALTRNGVNTYSHELTHIYEDLIWFNGKQMRNGVGHETYARGLYETEDNTPGVSEYAPYFNLNTAYELDQNRIQNASPSRFQTPSDVQGYMQGLMDVIYSLDAMEALAALKLDAAGKSAAFNKVVQEVDPSHAPTVDSFQPLSEAEANGITTLDQVVDAGLVSGRMLPKGNNPHTTIPYNEYVTAPLFEPIYAGQQTNASAVGGLSFRRNAHELLAEYGWENGLIAYVSNAYANDADALNAIMPEHGGNMATFKKAMFERRVSKFDRMKPVEGFANAAAIQEAMDQAVRADVAAIQAGSAPDLARSLAGGGRAVRDLKQRIFQSYLRSTNDFRDTIYKAPEPTEERETRTEEIPVEEEIILDDTILAGTPDEVVNPGQAGERELTYVYTLVNGQRQGEGRLENTRVTREMVKRQIRRGTKAMSLTPANVNAVDYTLPSEKLKISVSDNGTEKPVSEAGDVKFRFTVKETPTGGSVTGVPEAPVVPQANGELSAMDPWKFTGAGTFVIEVVQVPGNVEGIQYDTAPRTLTVVTEWEPVPDSAARRLVIKSVTFTKDGETITEMVLSNTVNKPSVTVEYRATVTNVTIPIQDEITDDPTLLVGTEMVISPGQAGEKRVTSNQRYIDGVADGEPEVTEEIITPMEKRQIRRGTKALVLTPGIVKPVQPADPGQGGNADQEQHKVGASVTVDLPIYPLWPGFLGGLTPSDPSGQPVVPLADNPQGQAPQEQGLPGTGKATVASPQVTVPGTKATVPGGLAMTGASSGALLVAGMLLGIGVLLRRR